MHARSSPNLCNKGTEIKAKDELGQWTAKLFSGSRWASYSRYVSLMGHAAYFSSQKYCILPTPNHLSEQVPALLHIHSTVTWREVTKFHRCFQVHTGEQMRGSKKHVKQFFETTFNLFVDCSYERHWQWTVWDCCPGRLCRQQITYLWVLKGRSSLKKEKNAHGEGRGGLHKWKKWWSQWCFYRKTGF